MNLGQALRQIAEQLNLDGDELVAYAAEDTVGGWDRDTGGWPVGSLWSVEGKVLYALVRARKPRHILEFGTGYGCSATHLLTAVARNGHGNGSYLVGVDNEGDATARGQIGARIPAELRPHFVLDDQSIENFTANPPGMNFNLIFEDGIHSPAQVRAAWEFAQKFLHPGGVMISHDAAHFLVGRDVQAGIRASGVEDWRVYAIEPSDCGLAIWQKPWNAEPPTDADQAYIEVLEEEARLQDAIEEEAQRRWDVEDTEAEGKQAVELDIRAMIVESLNSMTVTQLRDMAAARGLDAPAKAKKQQLVDLLVEAEVGKA